MTSMALLIMDVQQGMVDRFADHDGGYLDRLATAIAAARAADVMVGYVTLGFRPGFPPAGRGHQRRRMGRQPAARVSPAGSSLPSARASPSV